MRTERVLFPQSMSPIASITLRRAGGLSSGATASSRSRKMTSAADFAALANRAGWLPGTASSLRLSRGSHGSTVWKLIRLEAPLLGLRYDEVAKHHHPLRFLELFGIDEIGVELRRGLAVEVDLHEA